LANNGAGPANAFEKARETQSRITLLEQEIQTRRTELKQQRERLVKYRKEALADMGLGKKRGPRKKKVEVEAPPLIDARTIKTDD
jgi:hypothetical protein